jgi:hypothetical protein
LQCGQAYANALFAKPGEAARSHDNALDLIVSVQDEILNVAHDLAVRVLDLQAEQKISCEVLTFPLGFEKDTLVNHDLVGEGWEGQEGHRYYDAQHASHHQFCSYLIRAQYPFPTNAAGVSAVPTLAGV